MPSPWLLGNGKRIQRFKSLSVVLVLHWLEWHHEAVALVFYVKPDYGAETAEGEITGSLLFSLKRVARCDAKVPYLLSDF